MKTDVIITGHMRTFKHCIHAMRWQVLRHFDISAFYVSTIRDADTDSFMMLHELFPGVPVRLDCVDSQPEIPEPAEPVRFEPYTRSVSLQAVLRQLWQLERGWKLREDSHGSGKCVIRVRPDIFFHSFAEPELDERFPFCWSPWWGRFGGMNDRVAIMDAGTAARYFTVYSRIAELMARGCPLHPETMLAESAGRVAGLHKLRTMFSTVRANGEARTPEISMADIAEL